MYKVTRVRQTKAKAKNNNGWPIKKNTGQPTVCSPTPIELTPVFDKSSKRKSTVESLWIPPSHQRPRPVVVSEIEYSLLKIAPIIGIARYAKPIP